MKCRAGIFLYSRRFLLPPPRLFLLFPVLAWHYIRNSTCSLPLVLSLCSSSSSSTLFFTLVPSLLSELPISLWRRGAQTHEEARKYVFNKLLREKKMFFFRRGVILFWIMLQPVKQKVFFFNFYFDFYLNTHNWSRCLS